MTVKYALVLGMLLSGSLGSAIGAPGNNNTAPDSDNFEIRELSTIPIPPPAESIQKSRNYQRAPDGFSFQYNDVEKVEGFAKKFQHITSNVTNPALGAATQLIKGQVRVESNAENIPLTFKPIKFGLGNLIGAIPAGAMVNGNWSGLERFFVINGVGKISLVELDTRATGGKHYFIKEFINTTIWNKPAVSRIHLGNSNTSLQEVTWVKGGRTYVLSFSPDTGLAVNSGISAKKIADTLE